MWLRGIRGPRTEIWRDNSERQILGIHREPAFAGFKKLLHEE